MKVKYIKLKIIYFNIILLMVLMKKKLKYSVGDIEYSVLDRSQSFTNTQRYLEEVNTQYIDVTLDQIFYQLKEFQEQINFLKFDKFKSDKDERLQMENNKNPQEITELDKFRSEVFIDKKSEQNIEKDYKNQNENMHFRNTKTHKGKNKLLFLADDFNDS